MRNSNFLLDTSALISYIENEPGVDDLDEMIRDGSVSVPWSALLELYYITIQERDEEEALMRYASVRDAAEITVLWQISEPLLLTAARIKAGNRLSFADALVAAYAIEEDAILVHKDPEFDQLDELVSVHRLPYKRNPDAR